MKFLHICCLFGILALISCQPRTAVYTFQALEGESWWRGDTLTFPIDSLKAGDYDLNIYLRISNDYAYNTLWAVVEQDWREDAARHRDTLQILVADENGRLKGGGINGKQITQAAKPLHVDSVKHGCLRISHIMQYSTLQGVRDVGIRIKRR